VGAKRARSVRPGESRSIVLRTNTSCPPNKHSPPSGQLERPQSKLAAHPARPIKLAHCFTASLSAGLARRAAGRAPSSGRRADGGRRMEDGGWRHHGAQAGPAARMSAPDCWPDQFARSPDPIRRPPIRLASPKWAAQRAASSQAKQPPPIRPIRWPCRRRRRPPATGASERPATQGVHLGHSIRLERAGGSGAGRPTVTPLAGSACEREINIPRIVN